MTKQKSVSIAKTTLKPIEMMPASANRNVAPPIIDARSGVSKRHWAWQHGKDEEE
jgi:hypothetical protein